MNRQCEQCGEHDACDSAPGPKHVFFIDDDTDLHLVFKLQLEQRGYTVDVSLSAEDAFDRLSAIQPDIVLLDYRLIGGMNGLDALHRFQEFQPDLPVIMLTGVANTVELREECIRGGGYDLFPKPVVDWNLLDLRLQKALMHAADRRRICHLAAVSEAKRSFLRLIGHEIGTPLTPLISGLHELQDPEVRCSDEAPEIIAEALTGAERLHQLIGAILDVAELQGGHVQLDLASLPLAEEVDMVIDAVRPRLEGKGLQLTVDLDSPVTVWADSARLQQVIRVLLENAVKFTAEGRITVRLEEHDGQVSVAISDTGCGIAESKLAATFRLFEQVDESLGRPVGGAGIGLTLAKELIRLHQGNITVESTLGQGSTFTVTLPVAGPEEKREKT